MNVTEKPQRNPVASLDGGRPDCFGEDELVCPLDEEGVMQPQAECLSCAQLKACLQHALQQRGVIAKGSCEAPVAARVSRFFRRWSDQKIARSGHPKEDSSH